MELRWIASFVAVADFGSFLRAGEELRASQPTISGHIKDLERSLGAELIDRGTRPVQLTPAGRRFIRHARLILGEVESGVKQLRKGGGEEERGTVTIGTYPSASVGYIPYLLRRTEEQLPTVDIVLREMAGGDMESAAESELCDIFLRQSEPPLSRRRFGLEFLWRERFLVAVPRNHPWADSPGAALDPEELLRSRVLMTGAFQPESLLGHPFWRSLGGYPKLEHSVLHPQSLLALVENGLGVGLTTELPVAMSRDHDVIFRVIDHEDAQREVFVNWLLSKPITDHAKAVIDLMLRHPTPPALQSTGEARAGDPNGL